MLEPFMDLDTFSNSHTVVQTERTDGSLSSIVYASIEPLPPVLIEIQYQVSQDFMLWLIKLIPIILTIMNKPFSCASLRNGFTASRSGLLLETSSERTLKKITEESDDEEFNRKNGSEEQRGAEIFIPLKNAKFTKDSANPERMKSRKALNIISKDERRKKVLFCGIVLDRKVTKVPSVEGLEIQMISSTAW
ncbi:hypothetical protein EDC96DRAFT_544826 [Choanephora cucurbitarum]|nr:hypothetical protein EDC96DRAFT_544826 [Choanephora cucurbitarum]